jgi:hypothetical protein
MRDYAIRAVTRLARYPGLLAMDARTAPTPGETRLIAHGVRILLAAGFEPEDAARAISTYQTQLFGLITLYERLGRPRPRRRRRPSEPLSEAASHVFTMTFDDALAHGVDTVLDGLEAQLERTRTPRHKPGRAAGSSARRGRRQSRGGM